MTQNTPRLPDAHFDVVDRGGQIDIFTANDKILARVDVLLIQTVNSRIGIDVQRFEAGARLEAHLRLHVIHFEACNRTNDSVPE